MPEKQWHILLPPTIDPEGPESIADISTFTSRDEYDSYEALKSDIGRFDAIVVRTMELSPDLIAAADSLKMIAKHGAGMDNIDIDAATEHGVLVANTPGANSTAVAEHAVTLLLAVKRRVVQADRATRDGDWQRHLFLGRQLTGRTLGLFGAGNTGREVATMVSGFDVECLAYDPYVDAETLPENVSLVDSKRELFALADDVSVHSPLTDETYHAISTEQLQELPSHGVVVNTARGGIIDEDALAAVLEDGGIAGAGIDVYETEPPDETHPLFGLDTVVLTQHMAGLTAEALSAMSRGATANIRTVYDGGVPETAVNADDIAWVDE